MKGRGFLVVSAVIAFVFLDFLFRVGFFEGPKLLSSELKNPVSIPEEEIPKPSATLQEDWQKLNREQKATAFVFSRRLIRESERKISFYLNKAGIEDKNKAIKAKAGVAVSGFKKGLKLDVEVNLNNKNEPEPLLSAFVIFSKKWAACPPLDSKFFEDAVEEASEVVAEQVVIFAAAEEENL